MALAALLLPLLAGTPRELHLYTALDVMEAQIYVDAFTQDTGIPVRCVRLSAGELLTRVRTERDAPQASVWYGGASLDLMAAAKDGLLEPYQPATFDRFPADGRDETGRWTGIYVGIVAFASNPTVLARRGQAPPQSWAELLEPKFRGEVSMAYAYTSGTAYTVIASLVRLMGEDSAIQYLGRLDQNVHHYNRSGSACVTQVALGEVGTCISFSHDVLTKGVQKGYPVVLTFPEEGTGYEIGAMALLHGAPEPDEAKQFMDWALTKRAQSLLIQWNRLPIRDDVPAVERPASLKLVKMDPARAAADRQRIIERWREVTGQ